MSLDAIFWSLEANLHMIIATPCDFFETTERVIRLPAITAVLLHLTKCNFEVEFRKHKTKLARTGWVGTQNKNIVHERS